MDAEKTKITGKRKRKQTHVNKNIYKKKKQKQ